MYCTKCGRQIKIHNCICLKSKKLNRIEVWMIYIYLLALPMFLIVRKASIKGIDNVNYILIVSIILSILLLLLSLFSILMKKSYTAAFFTCHQQVERSFRYKNRVMNICSRCFGIYCGVFLSIPLFIFFHSFWVLLLALPLVIDGFAQFITKYTSTNTIRFSTGLLFGISFVYGFAKYNYYLFLILNRLISIFSI